MKSLYVIVEVSLTRIGDEMYKAYRILSRRDGNFTLEGKPKGWFKKWVFIDASGCKDLLIERMRDKVERSTVVSVDHYDHRGEYYCEGW